MTYKVQKILKSIMYNDASFEYRIIDESERIILRNINGEWLAKKICSLLNDDANNIESIISKFKR